MVTKDKLPKKIKHTLEKHGVRRETPPFKQTAWLQMRNYE